MKPKSNFIIICHRTCSFCPINTRSSDNDVIKQNTLTWWLWASLIWCEKTNSFSFLTSLSSSGFHVARLDVGVPFLTCSQCKFGVLPSLLVPYRGRSSVISTTDENKLCSVSDERLLSFGVLRTRSKIVAIGPMLLFVYTHLFTTSSVISIPSSNFAMYSQQKWSIGSYKWQRIQTQSQCSHQSYGATAYGISSTTTR